MSFESPNKSDRSESNEQSPHGKPERSGTKRKAGRTARNAALFAAASVVGNSTEATPRHEDKDPRKADTAEVQYERDTDTNQDVFETGGDTREAGDTPSHAGPDGNPDSNETDVAPSQEEIRRANEIIENAKTQALDLIRQLPAVTFFGGTSQKRVVNEIKKNTSVLKRYFDHERRTKPDVSDELKQVLDIYKTALQEVARIHKDLRAEKTEEAKAFMDYINAHSKRQLMGVGDIKQDFDNWRTNQYARN